MATGYIAEIRMFAGNFAPRGWAFCDGQLLSIAQNTALFSILGTTYGGDGRQTFALPDFRGRAPVHAGASQGPGLSSYVLGQQGGTEAVALSVPQLPAHGHLVNAVASGGNQASPTGNLPAIESTGTSLDYSNSASNAQMHAGMINSTGSGQPHSNVPPYLCVNFIIALQGIFPSRN